MLFERRNLSESLCESIGERMYRVDGINGDFMLLEAEGSEETKKRVFLEQLVQIAERCGFKPAWVYYRYKKTYDEEPPRCRPRKREDILPDLLRAYVWSGCGTLDWEQCQEAADGYYDVLTDWSAIDWEQVANRNRPVCLW